MGPNSHQIISGTLNGWTTSTTSFGVVACHQRKKNCKGSLRWNLGTCKGPIRKREEIFFRFMVHCPCLQNGFWMPQKCSIHSKMTSLSWSESVNLIVLTFRIKALRQTSTWFFGGKNQYLTKMV